MDRGAWQATVHQIQQSQTYTHTHTHTHTHSLKPETGEFSFLMVHDFGKLRGKKKKDFLEF